MTSGGGVVVVGCAGTDHEGRAEEEKHVQQKEVERQIRQNTARYYNDSISPPPRLALKPRSCSSRYMLPWKRSEQLLHRFLGPYWLTLSILDSRLALDPGLLGLILSSSRMHTESWAMRSRVRK